MNETNDLIRLLAQTDALWWPVRDWSDGNNVSAIFERRQAYRPEGVPFPVPHGADPAARKARERFIGKLETAQLVDVRRKVGRRVGWRLAHRTEYDLRSEAGQWPFWQTIAVMRCLAAHHEVLGPNGNGVWEGALAGSEDNSKLRDLADMLLLAFNRDWVRTNSDRDGHVGYFLTATGRQVLGDPNRFDPGATWVYVEATGDAYDKACNDAMAELRRAKPEGQAHVIVPLSSGQWEAPKSRKLTPFTVWTQRGKLRPLSVIEAAYTKARAA